MSLDRRNLFAAIVSLSTIIISFLFLIDFHEYLRGPAVYPPNWRWPYEFSFKFPEILFPILIICLITSLIFLKKIYKNEKLFLVLIIILGVFLQISMLYYGRAGIGVVIHRILNGFINGYFTASLTITSVPEFINNFNSNLENLPMYAKFHPPFSILFFDILNNFSKIIINFFPFIDKFSPNHPDVLLIWDGLKNYQKLTVLYSGFLICLLSMITAVPTYLTTKLLYGAEAARKSVMLFIFTPSLLLFVPLSDVFFPLFGITSFYFFVLGIYKEKKIYYFFSGLILCLGMYFTLTFIPFVLLFGIYYLIRIKFKITLKDINNGLLFSLGFIIIPFIMQILGSNIIETVLKIMVFHETAQTGRPYFMWLIFNLYDFFIFVGLPTFFILAASIVWNIKNKKNADLLLISFVIFLIILNLTGSVRAETGRIWLPLIPFAIIPAANFLEKIGLKNHQFALILGAFGFQILVFQTVLITLY